MTGKNESGRGMFKLQYNQEQYKHYCASEGFRVTEARTVLYLYKEQVLRASRASRVQLPTCAPTSTTCRGSKPSLS